MTDDFTILSNAELDQASGSMQRLHWPNPAPWEPQMSATSLFSNTELYRGHYTETAKAY